MAVRVSDLETAQAVMRILELCAEDGFVIDKFGGKRIG
jgi:hypothetical protein